jgi:hypothetical protein
MIRDTDFDINTFEQLLIRWICRCSISFTIVERPEFRALLQFLNDSTEVHLPQSHNTIRHWIVRSYDSEKLCIQQAVQSAQSKIHFTVDAWSSPNEKALLGMIGHYYAENGGLQHSVLAL